MLELMLDLVFEIMKTEEGYILFRYYFLGTYCSGSHLTDMLNEYVHEVRDDFPLACFIN